MYEIWHKTPILNGAHGTRLKAKHRNRKIKRREIQFATTRRQQRRARAYINICVCKLRARFSSSAAFPYDLCWCCPRESLLLHERHKSQSRSDFNFVLENISSAFSLESHSIFTSDFLFMPVECFEVLPFRCETLFDELESKISAETKNARE